MMPAFQDDAATITFDAFDQQAEPMESRYRGHQAEAQPRSRLMAAIARLHGFRLLIEGAEGDGCSIILECWHHDEVAYSHADDASSARAAKDRSKRAR